MSNAIGSKHKSRNCDYRFNLTRMFYSLDRLQDVVVFGCSILLVFEMMLILSDTFINLRSGIGIKEVTTQSLLLLILVELFRLLAVYLKHHRIYVGIAVEVAVVSILREIIVEGIIHMNAMQTFSICAFLFVLGALMLISYKVEGTVEH